MKLLYSPVPCRLQFKRLNSLSILKNVLAFGAWWLCLSAAAAPNITVKVELDRMIQTTFPRPETVAGETITLPSIYAKAGIVLTVEEDEINIARLTGPAHLSDPNEYDYINPSEIHALMGPPGGPHRKFPVGRDPKSGSPTFASYHIYGIVVDHYFEDSRGNHLTNEMGVTLNDTAGVVIARPFAIFHKHPSIQTNNAKFLRTTAHEIGHVFNLHHCDGDGVGSLMNTTETVGNSLTYEFRACELAHLRDHPKTYVWPEARKWKYVTEHHIHDHSHCRAQTP